MKDTRMFFAFIFGLWAMSQTALAKEDIILGDFEDGTYNGWSIEGDAFGTAPAAGTIGKQRQVTGFNGKGLVNTFLDGDGSQGTLTSPEFTIRHDFLSFLQGGGYWKNQTTIELLIDGQVVDAKVGRNSPNMEAKAFDLRELQGKTGQVRIADRTGRGWGFVVADDFVLTDTLPKGVRIPKSHQLTIEGRHLLVPIDNSDLELGLAPYLSVKLGDTLVYRGKVIVADSEDTISWWAHLPIPEAAGEDATLEYPQALDSKALELIKTSDDLNTLQPLYEEPLRPQLRFSQRFGWNNDPNGMLYYDGEYHLFFQSNPFGILWQNMFWGHAVSKDLIHWEERPYALRPYAPSDEQAKHHPAMSPGMCFSGGGAVDHNNTLGLQKGDTKTLFVTFTANNGGGERIATSTDKGKTWQVGDVIIENNGRDPKPFWHEPSQHWVIVVYNKHRGGGNNISFHTSKNLKDWEYQSHVPGFYECPEFFELPIDGDDTNRKWVLMGANAKYLLGKFDGKRFIPDSGQPKTVEEGKKMMKETIVGKIKTDIYAGQCFSNTPDGRVIYIGWAGMGGADKGNSFHHGFTVPIHLTLKSSPDGPRLNAEPIAEFDQLRASKAFSADGKLLDAQNSKLSAAAPAQEYDIVLKLTSEGKDGIARLRIGETEIPIDLTRDDPQWQFAPEGDVGTAVIRIICDRPFMEVVSGKGRRYRLINRRDRGKPLGEISLTHLQGSMQIDEFTVYRAKSIWK